MRSTIWALKSTRPKRSGGHRRLSAEGLATDVQESTTCCFAVQDKVVGNDPDGAPWECYTVLADASEEVGLGCGTEGCAPTLDEALVGGAGHGHVGPVLLIPGLPALIEHPNDEVALWRR